MNENSRKRREWVKTAAIIFLSIMLVLTFFSNTIMNYSLPEVAAQYVQSGTITAKIRGTGMIESGDPYVIEVKETRKVTSVAVKSGDTVQKGDVLLYLEDAESEELKAAQQILEEKQEALEAAWDSYDVALLAVDVNAGVLQNVNSNISTSTYRQQITAAQNAYKEAKSKAEDLQKQYNAIETQKNLTAAAHSNMENEVNVYNQAKTANDNAQAVLAAATNEYNRLVALLEYETEANAIAVSNGDAAAIALLESLTSQLQTAERTKLDAEIAANAAALGLSQAETAKNNRENTINDNLTRQQAHIQASLDAATADMNAKEEALSTLAGNISATLNLESIYEGIVNAQEAVEEAQEKVDEEAAKTVNATVTADIAGTISTVNIVAGESTMPGTPVVTMQPEGKGYTMSFSVTNEQAKKLSVGTQAELVNAWRYDDVTVTLASIKPDPSEPSQKKLLTFDVTGNIITGQSLSVSVGDKSANYDLIVPNSAIREDNNGKFILTVESKSSPLGNRYIATRVDVEVVASDDTQSAITGALYGYEFVITTSTKPVEAGKQVRLSDN